MTIHDSDDEGPSPAKRARFTPPDESTAMNDADGDVMMEDACPIPAQTSLSSASGALPASSDGVDDVQDQQPLLPLLLAQRKDLDARLRKRQVDYSSKPRPDQDRLDQFRLQSKREDLPAVDRELYRRAVQGMQLEDKRQRTTVLVQQLAERRKLYLAQAAQRNQVSARDPRRDMTSVDEFLRNFGKELEATRVALKDERKSQEKDGASVQARMAWLREQLNL